ncbi:MAG: hemin ABC transporter substrate-binding protein [Pseudomonadota bacterium]
MPLQDQTDSIEDDEMGIDIIYANHIRQALYKGFWILGVFTITLVISARFFGNAIGSEETNYKRIVAIGGSVTEIVYALGEEDRLIARDTTSVYPQQAFSLPDVGYIRQLSPEGVLSVNPDLILAMEGSGPPETMDTLKAADVPVVLIPEGYTGEKIREKILAVGEAMNVPGKAGVLANNTSLALKDVADRVGNSDNNMKVLFILSLREGKILAAGANTSADGIITMAGGENVITSFTGFKQVSDEAVITAQPDVVLMMAPRRNHSVSDEDVLAHPAIAQTPAGENRKIIRMDGLYLLGFGPRTAGAVGELHDALASAN